MTRVAGGAALAAFLVAGCFASAAAHETVGRERLRLDPLPKALEGVVVEVHTTLAPQLVVENKTTKTLEVLDRDGVPFLRIGPKGVEGNVGDAALYRTSSPLRSTHDGKHPAEDSAPRWRLLKAEPSWGWFDERLRAEDLHGRGHGAVARWRVALRIDGRRVDVTGTIEPMNPRGSWQAVLTSAPEPAPGVHISLLPGRIPALFLESSGSEKVTVAGKAGEPFLAFAADGVEANLLSPSWRENALARGETPPEESDPAAPPRWQRISRSPRYGWIEFRAWPGSDEPPRARAARRLRWSIPVTVAEKPIVLEGQTVWKPSAPLNRGH